MIFKDGKPSPFYQSYVKDVQEKITENAAAEFQCIWKEHARLQGAKPRTTISDELSSTLNDLQAELESSDLFEDVPSRKGVMRRAIPKTLVDQVGLETLLERLPEPYQRALFSSWVASHFVSTPPGYVICLLMALLFRSTNTELLRAQLTSSTLLVISQSKLYHRRIIRTVRQLALRILTTILCYLSKQNNTNWILTTYWCLSKSLDRYKMWNMRV